MTDRLYMLLLIEVITMTINIGRTDKYDIIFTTDNIFATDAVVCL